MPGHLKGDLSMATRSPRQQVQLHEDDWLHVHDRMCFRRQLHIISPDGGSRLYIGSNCAQSPGMQSTTSCESSLMLVLVEMSHTGYCADYPG